MNRKISGLIKVTLTLFIATAISAAKNSPPKVGRPCAGTGKAEVKNSRELDCK